MHEVNELLVDVNSNKSHCTREVFENLKPVNCAKERFFEKQWKKDKILEIVFEILRFVNPNSILLNVYKKFI